VIRGWRAVDRAYVAAGVAGTSFRFC